MVSKRVFLLQGIWLMALAVLVGRLFLIAIFPKTVLWLHRPEIGAALPAKTRIDLEHFSVLHVKDARGRILFRDGKLWSDRGSQEETTIGPHAVQVWAGSVPTRTPVISPVVGMLGKPDVWPATDRVTPEQGRSGLEESFDGWLRARRPGYEGQPKDGNGKLVDDAWYSVAPRNGHDIRTTIDRGWQHAAEEALKKVRSSVSAVVVLDVKSNQILAMAGFDTAHPARIPAIEAATPGSIYKLVVAAAGLESYQTTLATQYDCPGYVPIDGVRMRCWTTHGRETFEEALAQSCDTVFAELGVRLGLGSMSTMSHRMHVMDPGLQRLHNRPVLAGAEGGQLTRHPMPDNGWLANTAIGQEDVRVTPLWAANAAAMIARKGVWKDAQLVLDAEKNGKITRRFTVHRAHRALSSQTAAELATAMREAVTLPTGTAHDLVQSFVPTAVKTGTAELPGTHLVNVWRLGFAPYSQPDIAFCVFLGHVPSHQGHEESRQIVQDLLGTYKQFRPSLGIG